MTGLTIGVVGRTLVLSGDFDVRSTGAARDAIHQHLRRWDGDIVVDVHDVSSVDLTALRVVAAASRRASLGGHRIVLRGVTPRVLRMLHLSHLIRVVEVERDALAV